MMGRSSTAGMIEQGGTSDRVLSWHLTCNHYPPIEDGVVFARLAIEAVGQGRGDEPIDTGPDVRTPRRAPTARVVVESWHLEEFLGGGVMTTDRTEEFRRDLQRALNDIGENLEIEGPTWTVDELEQEFKVEGFAAPYVVVTRKSDGVRGTLMFIHSPRVYFSFEEVL